MGAYKGPSERLGDGPGSPGRGPEKRWGFININSHLGWGFRPPCGMSRGSAQLFRDWDCPTKPSIPLSSGHSRTGCRREESWLLQGWISFPGRHFPPLKHYFGFLSSAPSCLCGVAETGAASPSPFLLRVFQLHALCLLLKLPKKLTLQQTNMNAFCFTHEKQNCRNDKCVANYTVA